MQDSDQCVMSCIINDLANLVKTWWDTGIIASAHCENSNRSCTGHRDFIAEMNRGIYGGRLRAGGWLQHWILSACWSCSRKQESTAIKQDFLTWLSLFICVAVSINCLACESLLNSSVYLQFLVALFPICLLFPLLNGIFSFPSPLTHPPFPFTAEQAGNRLPTLLSGHRCHRLSAVWVQHRSHQCSRTGQWLVGNIEVCVCCQDHKPLGWCFSSPGMTYRYWYRWISVNPVTWSHIPLKFNLLVDGRQCVSGEIALFFQNFHQFFLHYTHSNQAPAPLVQRPDSP